VSDDGAVAGPDGKLRCPWGLNPPEYIAYHDEEWGRPLHGDTAIFERLCLEGFQSGLSWLTILRKRENFRAAFSGFDPIAVAAFGDQDIARLMADTGIVRNRSKINAAITNARAALGLPDGLDALVWKYAGEPGPAPRTLADVPASTPASKAMSAELKRHGFTFTGPVTAYATMQACGIVNDHLAACFCRRRVRLRPHGRGHPVHDVGQRRAAGADGDPHEPVARRAEVEPAAEGHPAPVQEHRGRLRAQAETRAVHPGQVARLRRRVGRPGQPLAEHPAELGPGVV
jgi:DNA-3-methyladenine glycosylase I